MEGENQRGKRNGKGTRGGKGEEGFILALLCSLVHSDMQMYTIQHRTVLIIFFLTLQTVTGF